MLSENPDSCIVSKTDNINEHEANFSKTDNIFWPHGTVAKRLSMSNRIVKVLHFFQGWN